MNSSGNWDCLFTDLYSKTRKNTHLRVKRGPFKEKTFLKKTLVLLKLVEEFHGIIVNTDIVFSLFNFDDNGFTTIGNKWIQACYRIQIM